MTGVRRWEIFLMAMALNSCSDAIFSNSIRVTNHSSEKVVHVSIRFSGALVKTPSEISPDDTLRAAYRTRKPGDIQVQFYVKGRSWTLHLGYITRGQSTHCSVNIYDEAVKKKCSFWP